MKITIIQGAFFPVPPILGGAVEKIWFQLGQNFASQGQEVTHISRHHKSLSHKETSNGVHYIRTKGYEQPSNLFLLKLFDLLYSIRAIKLVPDCDILVTNTFWLPILLKLPFTSHIDLSKTKLFVHVARYPKRQFIFYKHANRIQPVSTVIRDAIIQQTPTIKESVVVIPNPVPLKPISNGLRKKRLNEILFVGRIHPEKGLDILLKSYSSLPEKLRSEWSLRIIGPYEAAAGGGGKNYLSHLKDLCLKHEIAPIWQGAIYDDAKLHDFLKNSSLFVYPSIAAQGEASPLAPLEAMACGCVPIVSDMKCFSDYLINEHNGFTFKIDNHNPDKALTEVLTKLITNPERVKEARSEAIKTSKNFTIEKITKLYLEDFASIIDNHGL